ncbi:MAG: hypothetical protein WCY34_02860 [Candidatus Omnitrophota bacterium]
MQYYNMGYAIALQTTPFGGPVPAAVAHPGTAKTAWNRAVASAGNREFIQCILRQKMPEDIKGVPSPDDIEINGHVYRGCRYLMDQDMLTATHAKSHLFLDEFNHAGDDVLGAAQELVNSPPPNAWVSIAMNPVESSTSGRELAPAVVNRLCVVPWERPVDSRRAGWLNGFRNYPAPAIPLVPEDFLDTCGPAWGQIMCDFEDANMELFGEEAYPKDVNKACDPWPSDRSWTHVGILMSACDSVGAGNAVKAQLVEGCVGEAARTKFMQFLLHAGLPDFEQLLVMPESLKLPARYDLARATMVGVIGRVTIEPSPMRWEAACDVVECAYDQQPETAVSVLGGLWKAKPQGYMPRSRNGSWKELQDLVLNTAHQETR